MITDPEAGLSVEAVARELDELEAFYRNRRKRLRALLAVLRDEAGLTGQPESEDENGN